MKRFYTLALLLFAVPAIGQDVATVSGSSAADAFQPTVDTHVVEPGDTLWDLSEKILGSPWHWPKIWSFNPEITNPHWIYPGDVVRFYPSDVELPSQADLIAGSFELPVEDNDGEEEGTVEYLEEEEEEAPGIEVVQTAPVRRRPRRSGWRQFVNVFVTPKQLAEAGTLTNAVGDKRLLTTHDSVYLTFPSGKRPNVGDRFMVYRTLGEVVHPVTERRYGYMTQVTGLAAVEAVEKHVMRARLERTVVEVERGQYVTPMQQDPLTDIKRVTANEAVRGVVLAMASEKAVIAGEQQIVFVDKGSRDGLVRGNMFKVLSRGDPLTGTVEGLPERQIGELLIIQANETASTCLVTGSMREIEPGFEVVAMTH